MSLLMDALKKAEREKNKAAKKDQETTDSTSEDEVQEVVSETAQSPGPAGDEVTSETLSNDEGNDETWAFDTGELELEPREEAAPKQDRATVRVEDDSTVAETLADTAAARSTDGPLQEDNQTQKSEFDHDATLPSERAIQSSLKDYFEASQSITMDKASVSGPLTQNTSDHNFTNTSPLDTSATHVSAHTIFTANQTRQASTGLLRYAIFGTLFLALGLGAVALYYSVMTPSVTETAPIATVVPGADVQQSPAVDVEPEPAPFEPKVDLALNAEDPVVAGVVDAESKAAVDAPLETGTAEGEKAEQSNALAKVEQTVQTAQEKSVRDDQKTSSDTKVAAAAGKQDLTTTADKEALENDVVQLSSGSEPEDSVLQTEQRFQSGADQAPLDVMSSSDFADGLQMPSSAIKITRGSGKSRRVTSSDLMNAYQAYVAGDYINAKAEYRKVLNSRPDNRDARLGIAAIAVLEGNRETAYRHYQYLLQQNPKDEVVNAAIFNLQGNVSGGVNESQLKLLLDQSPNSPQLHSSLGSYYASQSRWPEAQQAFFDAVSADKNNADYAYNLAVSLDQIGQSKAAMGYYRQALKLADKNRVSFNTTRVLARIQKLSGLAAN